MRAAASRTCNGTSDPAHTPKIALTTWTLVEKTSRAFPDRERQIVTARFAGDPEVAAGISPFLAVRRNATASFFSELREQMRELMPKRTFDFRVAEISQSRIQRNNVAPRISAASGTA